MGPPQPANHVWVILGLGFAGIFLITAKLKKKKKSVNNNNFGAFIHNLQLLPPPPPPPPKAPLPLSPLTFALSDLFDIDGHVATFGHPEWARTHEAASQTCPVVSALVEGGATCIGTTVVDELAFGLSGENKHYGTPTNPALPARVPGGSSSGAAVAVAANLVDFALGVDTVGGVRVPAGFCGILGFRPSYGAVSHVGSITVSKSLDTIGWFARDPNILRLVGHILMQVPYIFQRNPRQIIIADDCFQQLNVPLDRSSQLVIKSAEKLFGRQVLKHINLEDYLSSSVPTLKELSSLKTNGELKVSSLKSLANVMQFLQRHEFRLVHEEWINTVKPDLHPAVSADLYEKFEVSDVEVEHFKSIRNEMRAAVRSLLKNEGILVIPTGADPPPKLGGKEISSKDYWSHAFSLLSIASISGCCQVTIPLGIYEKCPVSVSLIARHGNDCFLLDTLQTMYSTLQEQVDIAAKSKSPRNVVTKEEAAEIAKERGNQAYKDKQWQKAIGFYSEAIKLSSDNATYYSNRAQAYLELGSYLQAESDCTKAISLDKKNVKAYFRRGRAREMLGYYTDAIDGRIFHSVQTCVRQVSACYYISLYFQYALVLEPTNKMASSAAERLRKLFQ
ncbi:translocon at the outer membrane of chloroplasts 64-like isoform X1 [Arachis stenosperma]|uniref:translocon at the outer membrane of chloroplasts 64-like isoform X1 n=1 Tax=Arachis stenosperma TaxID=217475 RepID=UPI0025AB6BBB|nr:translocon at the outer membrane of chloroplasts 64-like isoform X1 [Arachis stenosperma]